MTKKFQILLTLLGLLISHDCVEGECLNSECQCAGNTMLCEHGRIPLKLPSGIKELFFGGFDLDDVTKIPFPNVSRIQKLDIQADKGKRIPKRSFNRLPNLIYLGLHGTELTSIDKDAFLGLDNLLTLNLSSNRLLDLNHISGALNSENRLVLPNLISLSVAKVKTLLVVSVNLTEDFIRSIATGRQLQYLDLSELNIYRFDFKVFTPLCKSVEFLDLRRSVIGTAFNYWEADTCTSLKKIDLSESVFPALRNKFSFQSLNFGCDSLSFFNDLEILFINKMNTDHGIEINGYELVLSKCPFHFRKIDVSENKIKWINMSVRLHSITASKISDINVSFNELEYVSPSVLGPSENIKILDLSHNKLHVMQENYRAEFEVLFWTQTKLLYLNLSHNGLTKLPKIMFSKNKMLQVLDISSNNIKEIDFSVVQLVNLEMLIASFNKLQNIAEGMRGEIELLCNRAPKAINDGYIYGKPLLVYLRGNRFICTCDNMKLIEWIYSVADDSVSCTRAGYIVKVTSSTKKDTEHFCTMQFVKKVATISAPPIIAALILSLVICVIIKKKRKNKQLIRAIIDQIEMGLFPSPYLVFLSYCSEDTEVVLDKVYPQLCKQLSEITHSNKKLVCCGDMHFRPGFAVRYEVMRCIEESSVVIAVISKDFCRKHWCNLEVGWAFDQNKPIILLMLEHVEKDLMDHFLQKIFDRYTRARWVPDENGGHVEPEWKIFCTSIIQLAGKAYKGVNSI